MDRGAEDGVTYGIRPADRAPKPRDFSLRHYCFQRPANKPLLQTPQTLVEGAHVLCHARLP